MVHGQKNIKIVNPVSFGISKLQELNRVVTDLLQCTVKYFINNYFDSVQVIVAGIYVYCPQSVTKNLTAAVSDVHIGISRKGLLHTIEFQYNFS
jgi:hypothetical protein